MNNLKTIKSKNVLITGSGGLIGSEAVNFFCEKGFDVIGIDNDMRSYYFGKEGSTRSNIIEHINLYKNYKHFDVDIRDEAKIEDIFKQFQVDLIIHTAAQPSHDWAAKEPYTDFSVNANATLILLENFRKYSQEAIFIFTSTNKVYGDAPNRLPLIEQKTRYEIDPRHKYSNGISEDMPIDNSTHSLFGVSKTAADLMVQEYGRYFKLKTGVFRGGCLTGSKHAGVQQHGFLSYLVKCILTGRKYTIFGYKGKQVRDNIHAHDLINAFNLFYQRPGVGEVYNIGGSRFANISILEAIEKIEQIADRKAKIEYHDQNRIGDHIWYISDISKFKDHYPDWKYEYDIDATIEDICRNSAFAKKIFSFHIVKNLDYWKERNWYYHNQLKQIFKEVVSEEARVLQVGYGLGDILASLFPKKGVSVDTDDNILTISKQRYPYITFLNMKPEEINLKEKFDYVIFPNSVDHFDDIQKVLERVGNCLNKNGKIVISALNPRWEQILYILEKLNLKRKEPARNWLRIENLKNLVEVSGFEVEDLGFRILLPMHIPILSRMINKFIKDVKFLSRFCVQQYVVARKIKSAINKNLTCSIIIPFYNQEEDEIKRCLLSIPNLGKSTEIIAVNQGYNQKSIRTLKSSIKQFKNVQLFLSKENKKDSAIKKGLNAARGDILITYDANLDIPASELERFYNLLVSKRAEFINGTRLIYPIEGQSMRQLNIIANLFFNWLFSWILSQRVTDMRCYLKAFYKKDYQKMAIEGNNVNFELLFSAAKNKLRILELPVHYNIKIQSGTKLDLIKHTLLLLKMALLGFWRLKVIKT